MTEKRPTLWVIGGGPLGMGGLRTARELGLDVVLTDRRADAPGFELADEGRAIDGTDAARHRIYAREVGERRRVVGVHCGAEFGLRSAHAVREELGLPGDPWHALERALDKRAMKTAFQAADVPTPEVRSASSADELRALIGRGGERWVIKPSTGSGSRGVRVLGPGDDPRRAWAAAVAAVPGERHLLVEPWLDGRSIDANGVFVDGAFFPAGVLEKIVTPPPECLPIGGYDPADVTPEERSEVYALLERAARSLGITHGPVKGDFLLTKKRGFVVLEVAPRFHGDVTTVSVLPFGSGIDPLRFWFEALATGEPDEAALRGGAGGWATWRALCLPPGRILHLPAPETRDVPGITLVWHNPRLGGRVTRYGDTTAIVGYVCARGRDREDAEAALERWYAGAGYRIAPDPEHAAWYARLRTCGRGFVFPGALAAAGAA